MTRSTTIAGSLLTLALLASSAVFAQTDGTCIPVSQRGDLHLGCFITARTELGPLPRDTALYWYIDSFPTLDAARSAMAGRSTAVQSLGHNWLFTIGPADWRGKSGVRVVRVGPLPLVAADSFAAVYMEGIFTPGMHSVVHRHPGAEAWYTLIGEQCLETPSGIQVQKAGGPGMMVAGGGPMMLTGTGTGERQSLVLILQDATQPRSTPAHDWMPRGLCLH